MSNWLAHWGHWAGDAVLLIMFAVAWVVAVIEARGRDRAEDDANEAYNDGYAAGYQDGLAARPEPEPEPAWADQATFYQPPALEWEPPSDWSKRLEDERLAWCQRVGIPFEDVDEPLEKKTGAGSAEVAPAGQATR